MPTLPDYLGVLGGGREIMGFEGGGVGGHNKKNQNSPDFSFPEVGISVKVWKPFTVKYIQIIQLNNSLTN